MRGPSPAALDRALRLLDRRPFILGPSAHPVLTQLQAEGLATGESVTDIDGRVSSSKLWRITPAGRAGKGVSRHA